MYDSNVIKSQPLVLSFFKYYNNNRPTNHVQKDVILCNNLYTNTFEDKYKHLYDIWISVAIFKPPFTSLFIRQILKLKQQLNIYYIPQLLLLNIIIYFHLTFTLFLFVFNNVYVTHFVSLIDVFSFVNKLYYYSSCSLQLLLLVY